MRSNVSLFLKAVKFSADKHRNQRREGEQASPYINHPIDVANLVWTVGGEQDFITLVAALLHDTIEDTNTTALEIHHSFGREILELVLEVSDDKSLPKSERKENQIRRAPFLSSRAKQIKLADKICNIGDIVNSPPQNWSWSRKMEYLNWAEAVVNQLRGANIRLEERFDQALAAAREKLAAEKPE